MDDIKVGTIADITPLDSGFTGLTLTDRDVSGEAQACHSATGAAGNGVDAPWRGSEYGFPELQKYTSPCSMQGGNAPGWNQAWTGYPTSTLWTQESTTDFFNTSEGVAQVGHGGILGMPRTDGFTDGFTTFQGVRTFDGNLGTWMEPDGYGGSVADPATRQSYQYAGGDPLMYVDASGYADSKSPIDDPPPCEAGETYVQGQGCVPDIAQETTYCGWECQLNTAIGISASWDWVGMCFGSCGPVASSAHNSVGSCTESDEPPDITRPVQGFTPEYRAGVRNGPNPATFYDLTKNGAIFNYNQYNQHVFRSTANFGLGVYAIGANILFMDVYEAIEFVGSAHGLRSDAILKDEEWAAEGYNWAYQNCHQ